MGNFTCVLIFWPLNTKSQGEGGTLASDNSILS